MNYYMQNIDDYKTKYLKYKNKYINLKNIYNSAPIIPEPIPNISAVKIIPPTIPNPVPNVPVVNNKHLKSIN